MTDERTFRIAELAREFDVTARTLRFYEDKGLLAPLRLGQARIYTARDRARLVLILRGRRLGFSLDEIGRAMGIPSGTVKSRLHNALRRLRSDPRTRGWFQR